MGAARRVACAKEVAKSAPSSSALRGRARLDVTLQLNVDMGWLKSTFSFCPFLEDSHNIYSNWVPRHYEQTYTNVRHGYLSTGQLCCA